jgi:hypothetical protein
MAGAILLAMAADQLTIGDPLKHNLRLMIDGTGHELIFVIP